MFDRKTENEIQSDLTPLCESSPNWVRKLSRGANLVLLGICLPLFLGDLTGDLKTKLPSVGPLLEALPGFMLSIGVWMLTSAEPAETRRGFSISTLARSLCAVLMINAVVLLSLDYLPNFDSPGLGDSFLILRPLLIFFVGYRVAELAMRIPNGRLASSARLAINGLAVLWLLATLLMIFFESASTTAESIWNAAWLRSTVLVFVLSCLVCLFWSCWILFRFSISLQRLASASKGHN